MSGSMTQRHNHDFHGQCKINTYYQYFQKNNKFFTKYYIFK